jgi:hypothetical protein
LIGTRLGASPIARSDPINPMYQMIHMAPSPTKPTTLPGFRSGTVYAEGGGIGGFSYSTPENRGAVTFRSRRGTLAQRAQSRPPGAVVARKIVNGGAKHSARCLIHNLRPYSQQLYSSVEKHPRRSRFRALPSLCRRPFFAPPDSAAV